MKKMKFSFALIIAILAVGVTVATKANFGQRTISGCFEVLTVTDGSTNDIISQPGVLNPLCDNAKSRILAKSYVRSVGAALDKEQECINEPTYFCCVEVTEVATAPSGVPLLNLGDGPHFYQIQQAKIFCREDQVDPAN